MPLSTAFSQTLLIHACPHCGNQREGTGSWFKSISYYECKACGQRVRVGYSDKAGGLGHTSKTARSNSERSLSD